MAPTEIGGQIAGTRELLREAGRQKSLKFTAQTYCPDPLPPCKSGL